jgi:hypothetical protein
MSKGIKILEVPSLPTYIFLESRMSDKLDELAGTVNPL